MADWVRCNGKQKKEKLVLLVRAHSQTHTQMAAYDPWGDKKRKVLYKREKQLKWKETKKSDCNWRRHRVLTYHFDDILTIQWTHKIHRHETRVATFTVNSVQPAWLVGQSAVQSDRWRRKRQKRKKWWQWVGWGGCQKLDGDEEEGHGRTMTNKIASDAQDETRTWASVDGWEVERPIRTGNDCDSDGECGNLEKKMIKRLKCESNKENN